MFGLKFILRVLMFFIAVGIASALLVLLWYGISRIFRWTWDAIERSNSDFATWFKKKFRNSEALPWLCRRGLHKWSKWEDVRPVMLETMLKQERYCLRCNYKEKKAI